MKSIASPHLPADPETIRLAQALAEATGKAVLDVIREAIAEKAEAAGVKPKPVAKLSREEKLRRITEISDRIARPPVIDPRSAEVTIGYNEHGLPG